MEFHKDVLDVLYGLTQWEFWVPPAIATLITLYWLAFAYSQGIAHTTGFWLIVWIVIFSPLEVVVIIAKWKEKKEKRDLTPKKSSIDALYDASI